MRRIAKAIFGFGLALALTTLTSCATPQNPYANPANPTSASTVGTGSEPSAFGVTTPSKARITGGSIDSGQSQELSEYLKNHRLPLVSAQVVKGAGGAPQVILFGYVATEQGQLDAENRTRKYLKDASVAIDNRIKINSEIANSPPPMPEQQGQPAASATSPDDVDSQMGSVQAYQQNQAPDQMQYQNQGSSTGALGALIPFIGMMVGAGGGGGGFGTGYGQYGGYGYPTYPPSAGGFGYGGAAPPRFLPFP
jgi:hypothetical protein